MDVELLADDVVVVVVIVVIVVDVVVVVVGIFVVGIVVVDGPFFAFVGFDAGISSQLVLLMRHVITAKTKHLERHFFIIFV